jgi:hypothetical protein
MERFLSMRQTGDAGKKVILNRAYDLLLAFFAGDI